MEVDELLTKRGLYINEGHLFDTSNQKPTLILTIIYMNGYIYVVKLNLLWVG